MTANSALVTETESRSFVFWILFATTVQVMNKLGGYGLPITKLAASKDNYLK